MKNRRLCRIGNVIENMSATKEAWNPTKRRNTYRSAFPGLAPITAAYPSYPCLYTAYP